MAIEFTDSFMKDTVDFMHYYKKLGDGALAQAPDAALTAALDPESNSIATIVKHLSGSMRSRWTDFLTTDGEKPGRDRDSEFESPPQTRAEVVALWEAGWKATFEALSHLTDDDLGRAIFIRGEAHSVLQALNRAITHYAYHVGQIVYLAKHFSGGKWNSLTIPKRKSDEWKLHRGLGAGLSHPQHR